MKKIDFLSIVIPVYNDEEVLPELHKRLQPVVQSLSDKYEILLIDDGSKDLSWVEINKLKKIDSNIVGIKLTRNYGQQNAISAGLDCAKGDYVVLMDSDLQDRPEDIPVLYQSILENQSSMAIAQWISREDSFFKKSVSKLFFKVSNRITNLNHQPNLGVFRIISRDTVEELKKYTETTTTTLSLLYWIGVNYTVVPLKRDSRFSGTSGYTIGKMLKLTADRIFAFSLFPIQAAIYSGMFISAVSFILAIGILINKYFNDVSPGWTSIVVLILFLFGINFIFIGILGEYLGRIFLETKSRPKYSINKII